MGCDGNTCDCAVVEDAGALLNAKEEEGWLGAKGEKDTASCDCS